MGREASRFGARAHGLRQRHDSLRAPEIARELYVSVNTVRTHMWHLYDKLGAHRRPEAGRFGSLTSARHPPRGGRQIALGAGDAS